MGALRNLLPLIILFVIIAGGSYIGYQVSWLVFGISCRQQSSLCVLSVFARSPMLTLLNVQIYLWSNEMADRGKRKMEKKHVTFTKDGMKVGVKELRDEEYADKTQKYVRYTEHCLSIPHGE